jgi:hypothetical protein
MLLLTALFNYYCNCLVVALFVLAVHNQQAAGSRLLEAGSADREKGQLVLLGEKGRILHFAAPSSSEFQQLTTRSRTVDFLTMHDTI